LVDDAEPNVLMAAPAPVLDDADLDGLVDLQEKILATNSANPDSDGDGYDDLVELARGSDPNSAASMPGQHIVHVGMTAREENGVVTLVSALYVAHGQFPLFGYSLGVSVDGVQWTIPVNTLLSASTIQLYPNLDATGWVVVLETAVPQAYIVSHGYLGVYSLISDGSQGAQKTAAVLNLFAVAGEVTAFGPPPSTMQGVSGGSIYQPLGRGEDLPASTWEEGEVCYQYTEVVGTDGSSVILDVENAYCAELDSYCNSSHCAGGIGVQVKVLDAGALAGGG